VADESCVDFLRWALPQLGLRWEGFRKVRRQVCRRLERRLDALGVRDLSAYRAYLAEHPGEWAELARLTPITISRFYRDRAVFAALERDVLPALGDDIRVWSAGCASGEEPYTVAMGCPTAEILATDVDPVMLRRTEAATYESSSLRELPEAHRRRGFDERDGRYVVRPEYRRRVIVRHHDLGAEPPAGPFDLVLSRNVTFTYFDTERQRVVLARLREVLRPGGALVIGLHERLPEPTDGLVAWPGARAVFRRTGH
jgi:chemotaxis protein methyltransferase CheR